jgi:hypothetical protein
MTAIELLHKNMAALILTALFLLIACKDDPTVEASFDKSLLLNKWHLYGGIIIESGIQRALTIDSCKQDDFIQLNPENKLLFLFGDMKCNPLELDSLYRNWHIIDDQLDLDNILYDVIGVTPDSMNLRRKLSSGIGDFTTVEYYYLN